jgi:2-methylisocitrate lyase-like PEP mutase family enzyme
MTTLKAKAEKLLALHAGPEVLVLPNAWDAASAAIVAQAGFPAIATTSAGVAFALGYPDNQWIERDEMLEMVRRIARAVSVPVTADMEGGYGIAPEIVAETVRLTLHAGAVGANLEDSAREIEGGLIEAELAAERIRAARAAADAAGIPFVINARTDPYMIPGDKGEAAFAEAVRRGNAYREAGADCIFVPGVSDAALIGRLAKAINAPLNVLGGPKAPPVPEMRALGVRRVSVGGSLSRATLALVRRAAVELRDAGTYGFAADAIPHAEMNKLFGG